MRSAYSHCIGIALLFCFAMTFALPEVIQGQLQQPVAEQEAAQKSQTAFPVTGIQAPIVKPKQPYKPSVRVHIEKGTNKGYLVLQLDLQDGHHIYSLNPKGSPMPTKIAVTPSKDIKVLGGFTSDKQPLVIEKDPVFQRRIEKHKGVVQFFAPIEVRPGIDLAKLAAEVSLTGQVCSASACRQVKARKVVGKFASFFDVSRDSAEKTSATTAAKPSVQR